MIYHCHIRNAYPESIALKSPLAAAATNFLRNGYKKAKPHTTSSHKILIWNTPLLLFSMICQIQSFDTHFILSCIFLYNLFPRLPSSVGILTLQNFFFAALNDSKLNLSSSFCYAYSDLYNFFTPLKYLLLIYSRDGPGCVSNYCCLLIH